MLKELEVAIERLQALYNQYFMGIERLEPLIPKKTVERQFNELRRIKFSSTALRFRFQSQVQKYSTHLTHWRRICRQIEEGTYKRDIMRAKARVQTEERLEHQLEGASENERNADSGMPVFDLEAMLNEVEDAFEQGFDLDEQLNALTSMVPNPPPKPPARDVVNAVGNRSAADDAVRMRNSGVPIPLSSLKASRKTDEARRESADDASATRFKSPPKPPPLQSSSGGNRPKPPPPPAARAAAAPLASAVGPNRNTGNGVTKSVDDQKIQSVYRAYVAARKRTNERTDNISVQKIGDILRKTEKAKGGVSDFKVVIRDGKAVIKAVK